MKLCSNWERIESGDRPCETLQRAPDACSNWERIESWLNWYITSRARPKQQLGKN
jgi:hypothetical protein